MRSIILSAATLVTVALVAPVQAAAPTSNSSSYPLTTCIVSGETLGAHGDVVTTTVGDREVRLCCKMCVKDLEKDPEGFMQTLDAAIIEAQRPIYPLETCVVSGEPLGSMGEPVERVVGNRLVRLCCSKCEKELDADPTAFIAKLDAAVVAAQVASYPADVCPISGETLGGMGDPYDYVYAGRLVRFCCPGCIDTFDENPSAAMAKVYGSSDDDH